MSELEKLRPEVREAMDEMDRIARIVPAQCGDELRIIRAELLRLHAFARELDEERIRQVALRFDERIRAEKAESELAALKARMRPARVENGEVRASVDPADEGKYVAVLVVEE